jgi:hypothetical protein
MLDQYKNTNIPEKYRINDPLNYLSTIAEKILPLMKWNFTESSRRFKSTPNIVYVSDVCKVMVKLQPWEPGAGFSLDILYGRSHAPDDTQILIKNEQKCYCWHRIYGMGFVLNYLDNISPEKCANSYDSPAIIDKIKKQNWWNVDDRKMMKPELSLRMEAEIWEYYGCRLFDLFDLNRPDLWEEYQSYMTQIYDIKGRSPNIKPSLDKIC